MAPERSGTLVVVNNAPFQIIDGERYVEPPTGVFLDELRSRAGPLVVAQGAFHLGETRTANSHNVDRADGVEASSVRWDVSRLGPKLRSYLRALPWILRNVWRARFVYVFMPGHLSLLYCLAARLLGRPYGTYVRGEIAPRLVGPALGGARFAVAVNGSMRETAARVVSETYLVRPMAPLDASQIVEPTPAKAAGEPLRLLFVGRTETPKGIAELLDAVAAVRGSHPQLELHLAGWAPEIDAFRDRAQRLGLGDAVIFHGMVTDRGALRRLYDEADLFVLPTYTEGFPRVLYEAMAYGVPILTTFVGGIPALMRDGENCLEIPVRDAAGLAGVLERALGDAALRDRLTRGGFETIQDFLDPTRPSHAEQVALGIGPGGS